jgi:diketogulonate reductase-like aldo/keto reductase
MPAQVNLSRRQILQAALLAALPLRGEKMQTRKIPSSGEPLPVVGMGTWQTFDTTDAQSREAVLQALFDAGGTLIDSSPMYGRSEETVGEVLKAFPKAKPFVATKVWTSGREQGLAQMQRSIDLMGRVDLMQIHNLLDWRTHVKTLRELSERGTIRYWGITHYSPGAFGEMEAILKSEKPDFVQLPYSVGVREAEKRLLPACADNGAAVLVMRPFEGGSLFNDARKKPLPELAKEIDCTSWAQLFLKFVLGHPAVNCPIPASANPQHLADDLRAGFGRMPGEKLRQRIAEEITRG